MWVSSLINYLLGVLSIMQQWRVSVFGNEIYHGNAALVVLSQTPMTAGSMRDKARQSGAPASCFAWPKDDSFQVHCFSPHGAIACCGHGLLAAAYVLHDWMPDIDRRWLYHGEQSEPLQVRWHDEATWVTLPRMIHRTAPVPQWAKNAFSSAPVAAAEAGGEEGYLILEFDKSQPLIDMDVVHQHIVANTHRAVIVTQAGDADYDFLLRYFAPQYGVEEDAVTGSANRVLADYWASRTGKDQFRALQCSRSGSGPLDWSCGSSCGSGSAAQPVQGGIVLSRLTQNSVEIGGAVQSTDNAGDTIDI